jgi:hypothetical protein
MASMPEVLKLADKRDSRLGIVWGLVSCIRV